MSQKNPQGIHINCPAKVNLALSVGSPAAGGMHPIASWMVAVQFGDRLTLRPSRPPSSYDIGFEAAEAGRDPGTDPGAGGLPGEVDWSLEEDLGVAAHRLLEQQIGRRLPVEAVVRKMIPPGAGLGGGSSDAAGMLVGINRLFELGLDDQHLSMLGGELGSDVPFLVGAILGRPSALVAGCGETLKPLSLDNPLYLVLIFPSFGCPTAAVYRAWDRLAGQCAADTVRLRQLAGMQTLAPDAPFNDLTEPACIVRPDLRRHLEQLGELLKRPVHLTGSGSAMFVVASDQAAARQLAGKVTATTGLPAVATRTVGRVKSESGRPIADCGI